MNATQILSLDEIGRVLRDFSPPLNPIRWSTLIVFRLSCCCGMRRKELCGLRMADITVDGSRPCITVQPVTTKAVGKKKVRKARMIPLWWDSGTLADLTKWRAWRLEHGAGTGDPFVCSLSKQSYGKPLTGKLAALRWKTAIKCLGPARVEQLSVHDGRHTWISQAIAAGHSLVAVRDGAGHSSIATTDIYTHLVEEPMLPDVFAR